MNTTEIKLSKRKLFLTLAGASLFVIMGYFLIIKANRGDFGDDILVRICGWVSIVFFGATLIFALVKLFDNKPGLILNEKGITDNASGVSAGFIAWNDITDISMLKVQSTRFLLIFTKDPKKYLAGKNKFKVNMMRINAKMYGTPLSISATALQYKFDDLEKLVFKYWETYR